jgi:hypothetical protein
MKLLKMFSLVALAALMAMALAGAGSAMAESTALCEEMPDVEDAEDGACTRLVEHVREETLSGHPAKLLSSALNVECDVSFLGDVLGLASPQVIHNGKLTYTNCNAGCVVKQEGTALIKVLRTGHETAEVTGEGQVHVECGQLIDCKYNGTGLKATARGPLLAVSEKGGEVTLSEQTANRVGGAFCPSTAKLEITTTPACPPLAPVYIAK